MTRVEKNEPLTQRLEEVEGKVVREIQRERRRFRPFLTCGAVFLLLLVSFFVWVGWTVAATGLVEMPFFSSMAYNEPSPIRVVTPGVPMEVVAQQQLEGDVAKRLQQGNGSLQNRSVTLTLSESSFTASLRTLLDESGTGAIDPSGAQAAIEAGRGIQLFIPLDVGSRATAVSLWVEAEVEEGRMTLRPSEIRVGSARVPQFFVRMFVQPIIDAQLRNIQQQLASYATVESVTASQGELTLTGKLSVEVLEGDL